MFWKYRGGWSDSKTKTRPKQLVGKIFILWLNRIYEGVKQAKFDGSFESTYLTDQLFEVFMCKKAFYPYFISTQSPLCVPFLSCVALRICFLTHFVEVLFTNVSVRRVASVHHQPGVGLGPAGITVSGASQDSQAYKVSHLSKQCWGSVTWCESGSPPLTNESGSHSFHQWH